MPITITTTSGPFTGYTLAEMRALILRMLRAADTTRFSPTKGAGDYDWIDDALNRGQDDFVRATKCLRSYAIVELEANQRSYRLPDDFLDLMAAYYYDSALEGGYQELTVNTVEELNDEYGDWRTKTGDHPSRIYIDRSYGSGQTFGLYPIPNTNGDVDVFSSEHGVAVEWVCPLYTYNQDYGEVIRLNGVDEYILPTEGGAAVDVEAANKNIFLEYYRLPTIWQEQGTNTDQKSEIPREYQKALAAYAAADLLSDNPEDSVEYKRAERYRGIFDKEVQTYTNKRKRALSGRNLRARPVVWNWQQNMTHYKELA